jgi:hypothetical protein
MEPNAFINDLQRLTAEAVAHYWVTRITQQKKQNTVGKSDQGLRSAVTGGAQLDGFIRLFAELVQSAGISDSDIYYKTRLELPGFYRPTKEWDLLVVRDNTLIVAIEAKSQVGPSFGNNFNNRTEEAMGSALDLWTAYREGAFLSGPHSFLGYFFMLEDCPASQRPVRIKEPHFKVFPEFVGASYMKRYELFCRKLMLERHYTSTAFITSNRETGMDGHYMMPAPDISLVRFARTLIASVSSFI